MGPGDGSHTSETCTVLNDAQQPCAICEKHAEGATLAERARKCYNNQVQVAVICVAVCSAHTREYDSVGGLHLVGEWWPGLPAAASPGGDSLGATRAIK